MRDREHGLLEGDMGSVEDIHSRTLRYEPANLDCESSAACILSLQLHAGAGRFA